MNRLSYPLFSLILVREMNLGTMSNFVAEVLFICFLVCIILCLWNYYSRSFISDVDKKFVLVTGCDCGFGRETALTLDKLGFGVFATCLTKEGEESLKAVASSRVFPLRLDVTDSQMIKAVNARVKELLPPDCVLWGVVNNAGVANLGLIEWMPFDEFKQIADVNLWGLIDVTKTFLPLIKKAEGRVVNFSSMLGQLSFPTSCAYSITKYGVQAFSDALRREMSPWNVRVSIIEPGSFKTRLMDGNKAEGIFRRHWESLSEEIREEYSEEYVERKIKIFHKGLALCSSHTYKVVNAVVDALMSNNPQTRYQVGLDSKLVTFMALLPSYVPDMVLRRLYSLNK